jgi:hypothetical protein
MPASAACSDLKDPTGPGGRVYISLSRLGLMIADISLDLIVISQ